MPDPICALCRGSGHVTGLFPVYAPSVSVDQRKPVVELDCWRCGGAGVLTTEQLARIASGDARRAQRVARGVGLREEAERLGMLPSELCDIECGRAKS